jgi:hypothetical protein
VLASEQVDLELSGPALDLDTIEQLEGEERRIDGNTVDSGRDVGYTIEIVFRGRGASPPVVHRLGPADVAAPPEVDAGNLGEQVGHGGGISPLDGVAGEDNPGKRRSGTLGSKHWKDRHPHSLLRLLLEISLGRVHRVATETVYLGSVLWEVVFRNLGRQRKR